MHRPNIAILQLLLALCCAVNITAQDSSSSPPKQPLRRSTEAAKAAEAEGQDFLFQKHDVKSAIESFKKTTQLDPWYAHGHFMLGVAYMQAQNWDHAQWAFEAASKVDPDDPQAWLGIGSALNEQKSYVEAQKALTHSLDLKPESAEAHYELARSLWGLQKLEPAETEANRAIELNKDYVSPHVLMGNIYLDQSDPDDAIAEFREALRLEPQGPQANALKQNIAEIQRALNQTSQTKKP
ncbi:MAG TPA: tetratricopeptide repeat protein [Candidatus Angelobacter sp.]